MKRFILLFTLFLFCLLCIFSSVGIDETRKKKVTPNAVEKPTPAELGLKWWNDQAALKEASPFKNLKRRFMGPWVMSGRKKN